MAATRIRPIYFCLQKQAIAKKRSEICRALESMCKRDSLRGEDGEYERAHGKEIFNQHGIYIWNKCLTENKLSQINVNARALYFISPMINCLKNLYCSRFPCCFVYFVVAVVVVLYFVLFFLFFFFVSFCFSKRQPFHTAMSSGETREREARETPPSLRVCTQV